MEVFDVKNTLRKNKKLSSDELSVFCTQVSMLLTGGITLVEGIYIIHNEVDDKLTKETLRHIEESLEIGEEFYNALDKTHRFPEYMIYMVKIGETTGNLDSVLVALANYYERESQMKANIRNAITYPFVLFTIMSVVLYALVYRILPLFESMLFELSVSVSMSTDTLLTFGLSAGKYITIGIGLIFALLIFMIVWYSTEHGKEYLNNFLRRLYFTKKIMDMLDTGKFISSMALMISSGMDMEEALSITIESSNNKKIHNKIRTTIEYINKGLPIDEALRESNLIVGIDGRMLSIASKSGASDTMFIKLSKQYNDRTTISLNKISAYIDTTLVVSLSLMVGTVLLAVMIPLVNMISSIG